MRAGTVSGWTMCRSEDGRLSFWLKLEIKAEQAEGLERPPRPSSRMCLPVTIGREHKGHTYALQAGIDMVLRLMKLFGVKDMENAVGKPVQLIESGEHLVMLATENGELRPDDWRKAWDLAPAWGWTGE